MEKYLIIFLFAIFSTFMLQTTAKNCEHYKKFALEKCRSHYGTSLNVCMHKRMKRSPCKSESHCGECNCAYCSNNDCSSRCNSCCEPDVYEEEEICDTSYCCYKKCHKKCYTPTCRRTCRNSCLKSVDKQIINNAPSTANITTVINLHNKINNTNVIDIPVKINTTNANNFGVEIPGAFSSIPESESQKEDCCELLVEVCDPQDNTKCNRVKRKYCGKECSTSHHKSPEIHLGIPQQQYWGKSPQQYYPFRANPQIPPRNIPNYPLNYPQYFQNYPQVFPQNYYPQKYNNSALPPQQIPPSNPQTITPNIPNYPSNYPQYPQNYPRNFPQNYYPQNYNSPSYMPSQLQPFRPRCTQSPTYPFLSCNENAYPNQWPQFPNQQNPTGIQGFPSTADAPNNPIFPNNLIPQNSQNTDLPRNPFDFSEYAISPNDYGTIQDFPGEPMANQDQASNSDNFNNNDEDLDNTTIDEDDNEDEDEDSY